MTSSPLELVTNRECGDCRLCCKVMAVGLSLTEFEETIGAFKPGGDWCPHACDAGCAIYPTRPQSCHDFRCAWLRGIVDDDALKPDRAKIVASLENGPQELAGPWWVLYEAVEGKAFTKVGDRLCERLLRINVNGAGVCPVARMDAQQRFTHIRYPGADWQPIFINEVKDPKEFA